MSEPISVVFMGTPDFAVPTLAALIDNPQYEVRAVVTQPDRPSGRGRKLAASPVKQLALGHGLPVLQPHKAREPENVERLGRLAPDYLVVVAYGQILPVSILSVPKVAPVNLHASLLPRWRGAAPIHRAFLEGDTVTGVCVMIMEEGLDTGDVIALRRTEITGEDTVGRLHDRLARIGAVLMAETLPEFRDGRITPVKQDDSQATYAKKLEKSDFAVDWTQPAGAVSRRIRGLSPFPGARISINGKTVKPLFAKTAEGGAEKTPGMVLLINEEGIQVACGEGSLVITDLKPEGKGPMKAHAFTLGSPVTPGDIIH